MLDILLPLAAINGVLAIPLMLLWKWDFAKHGHISPLGAAWSGVTMHGHAILTFAVCWIDRGSLAAPTFTTTVAGFTLIVLGAGIIVAGRYAYGSQKRVYGLLEDKLIEGGIYRFSRNPQYFGYGMMLGGAAVASLSAWGLLLAAVFLPAVHLHIIWVEEPHLRRRFGQEFADFCARAPRYFGLPHRG